MHFTSSSGSVRRFPAEFAFEQPLGAVPVRGADPPHIRVKQSIQNDPHITADDRFPSAPFKRPHASATNRFHHDTNRHLHNPITGQFQSDARNKNNNDNQHSRSPVTAQFQDDFGGTNIDLGNPIADFFEDSHQITDNQFRSSSNPAINPFIRPHNVNTHGRDKQQIVRKPQVEQLSDFSDELPTGWMVHQQRPR